MVDSAHGTGDYAGSSSGLSRGAAHHPSALHRSPLSQRRSTSHPHPPADVGISGKVYQERALPLPGEPRTGRTATPVLGTGLEVFMVPEAGLHRCSLESETGLKPVL